VGPTNVAEHLESAAVVAVKRDSSTPYAYICECVADVQTTPEAVNEAARAWAQDAGWHERHKKRVEKPFFGRRLPDNLLIFNLYRRLSWAFEWTIFSPDLTVESRAADSHTEVTFQMGVVDWRYSSQANAMRTCERFARGVCSDLGARGIAVIPPELSRAEQNRSRLQLMTRLRSRVEWALAMLFAACAIGWFITLGVMGGAGYPPLGGLAYLAYFLVMDLDVVRERMSGRKAWGKVVLATLLTIAGGFILFLSV
jgi:hypothetical protein